MVRSVLVASSALFLLKLFSFFTHFYSTSHLFCSNKPYLTINSSCLSMPSSSIFIPLLLFVSLHTKHSHYSCHSSFTICSTQYIFLPLLSCHLQIFPFARNIKVKVFMVHRRRKWVQRVFSRRSVLLWF